MLSSKTQLKTTFERIAILGAGSWGSALAHLASLTGRSVILWDRNCELIGKMQAERSFLKPMLSSMSSSVECVTDLSAALNGEAVDLLVSAVSSEGASHLLPQISERFSQLPPVLSATKGLDMVTGRTVGRLWKQAFPNVPFAVISGPNLALDAIEGNPMRTIVASDDLAFAARCGEVFCSDQFLVECTTDVLGLEICGAVKNVIAIAAGAWDGFELGDSGKGAMLCFAIDELVQCVVKLGGSADTVYSVGGLGDMFITCNSTLSRNYRSGLLLAKGKSVAEINVALGGQVSEGMVAAPLLMQHAQRLDIGFKIGAFVCKLIQQSPLHVEDLKHFAKALAKLV